MPLRQSSRAQLPSFLAGPYLVHPKTSTPRYWATIYAIKNWSGNAQSTIRKKLRAIESLYNFTMELYGYDVMDSLIGSLATDKLDQVLEAYFISERNRAAFSDADINRAWRTTSNFILETLRDLSHTSNDKSRLHVLSSHIKHWELRYRNLSPNPIPKRIHVLRALPSRVIEELYTLFEPNSPNNPFRSEPQRWRNMAILLCLLHQGLRRSEALLLTANAVKTGTDERTLKPRYWMNVHNQFEDEDPRFCDPPAIKNSQSIRQIPVSPEVAEYIDTYVTNYRGRSPHPQLFLNNRGTPLGVRGLGRIFDRVSTLLSDEAKLALQENLRRPRISSHDFRHTCAVIRLAHFQAHGKDEDESLAQLRAFFGWTYTSNMPRLYARAYWERQIETIWNDDFDAHVDALRTIEPGRWG